MIPSHPELTAWAAAHAAELDRSPGRPQAALRAAPLADYLGLPVPVRWGGQGRPLPEAVQVIASVAEGSLAAAFTLWSHWVVVYYLLESDNPELQETYLPALATGARHGSTGMANALKNALGLEPLNVQGEVRSAGWRVSGTVRWASNLVGDFLLAVPVQLAPGEAAAFLVPAERAALTVQPITGLLALDGTATGSVALAGAGLTRSDRLHRQLPAFLVQVRPYFTVLQAAFCLGLSRAALASGETNLRQRAPLMARYQVLRRQLTSGEAALARLAARVPAAGLLGEALHLRLELGELTLQAALLDLEAAGGPGYLASSPVARRYREALFLPVQSPTFLHLRMELESLCPSRSTTSATATSN